MSNEQTPDNSPQDNSPQDNSPQDNSPQDNVAQDNVAQDNVAQDNVAQHSGPVIGRQQAPDHGPTFWGDLHASMGAVDRTQEIRTTQPAAWAGSPHAQTQELAAVQRGEQNHTVMPMRTDRPRLMWPLAAAAALLVLGGLGFLVAQRATDPATTTQVAAGATETAQVEPLDGPEDEAAVPVAEAPDPSASVQAPAATEAPVPAPTPFDGAAASQGEPSETGDVSPSTDAGDTGDTSGDAPGAAAAAIPDFAPAPGASGEPDYLPLDQGLPANATFLSNWPERALSWYAVVDSGTSCANADHSVIRYVNGSGLTQDVRDPQLGFSGEISNFTVRHEQNLAAWLVSCGTQLELYVANLEPTGRIVDQTLAWFGDGSISTVLVQWTADEVSLSSIEPGAEAFSVAYNVETGLLSRNGGPSRIMLEAGAPAERSLTPLAASTDAGLTYWAGKAPPGTVSACKALFGSGQSDTIWLRQGEGQWQRAVAGDFPTGTVTAAAIEPETLQIAFADVCAGQAGRVVIGNQLDDGRIADAREVDLTPYVPGFAAQLFWVDRDTLRIETDNTEFGFGTVRFDYRLADSLIVQLD